MEVDFYLERGEVVVNSGINVVTYASVVDQITEDATTIPMR